MNDDENVPSRPILQTLSPSEAILVVEPTYTATYVQELHSIYIY